MSSRKRRSTASAITLAAAVTAGAALLLAGCGPASSSAAPAASPSALLSGSPSASAGAGAPSQAPSGQASGPAGSAPSTPVGGVPVSSRGGGAGNGLTISDGTDDVVVNGVRVDFGTVVRDLSWSPDGSKAAFIDGSGDLVVAHPDGSGRVVVARNPGNQVWSHPAWQVTANDSQYEVPAKDNLFFAASVNGVSRLESVPATAVDGSPQVLQLNQAAGDNVSPLPQTGNAWPSTGGAHGTAVYANAGTGEVYIRDDYLRQQGMARTAGSEPALSPDEQEFVFVRSVDGHDHLFELDQDSPNGSARDLTPGATTDYTEPAWSPDGRTIAARTPAGIVTLPADGSAAPVLVSTDTGLPAYRG
jgi:Tol biopolymer transport system component